MFAFLFSRGKNRRVVRDSFFEIEPQEVLLDKLAKEKEHQGFREQQLEVPLSHIVLRFVYGAFLVFLLLFLAKTFDFQVFDGQKMAVAAENNIIRATPIVPERGVIYDGNLLQLAFNRSGFDLVCDKRDLPAELSERESSLRKVANVAATESEPAQAQFEKLKSLFDGTETPRFIAQEDLSHEQLVLWEARKSDISGCMLQETIVRKYADIPLAHILGYTAKINEKEFKARPEYFVGENIGKVGLEQTYEGVLRGEPGEILVRRDSFGEQVGETQIKDSVPGNNIVLWLDAGLQLQVEKAFYAMAERTGLQEGAVVALDPRTGGVLALASFPSFDNNLFSGGVDQATWNDLVSDPLSPMFNRVISGVGYPTGSVIKPLIGIAALEEGVITPTTVVDSPLEICVVHQYTGEDQCFRDWTYHGPSDIKRAIAESVNTFFYKIGGGFQQFEGLGPEKIKKHIQEFGWGEKTGIDLPGEGDGKLPDLNENWRLGDTYHFSIGQGPFAVTPIQVASAFVAIANGGTLYEPRSVKRVIDGEKNTVYTISPVVKRSNFLDTSYLATIREGMRQTVTKGSATSWLNGLPVDAAAKTGTAQTGRYTADGKNYLYSWTVAFAPFENPEIVMVVLVENAIETQAVALPIIKDSFEWYFSK